MAHNEQLPPRVSVYDAYLKELAAHGFHADPAQLQAAERLEHCAQEWADYKAKRDEPLQLHYGVAQVSDANCSPGAAEGELAPRLAGDGWTLLNVLSTFGPEGLEERKASAGDYFLRY